MQRYLAQLLEDIAVATDNLPKPYCDKEASPWERVSPEEEDAAAPVKELEEHTGIYKEQLPPADLLSDGQIAALLQALNKLLDECNWHFVMQISVPERIQYAAMRDYWNQPVKIKQWHTAFFELCRPGAEHYKCALGEYCHCAFFAEFF